jgi:hypothetical protein
MVGFDNGRLFKVTNANISSPTITELTVPFVGAISDIQYGTNDNGKSSLLFLIIILIVFSILQMEGQLGIVKKEIYQICQLEVL